MNADVWRGYAVVHVTQAQGAREWCAARRLVEEYVDSLGVDLSFQNIAHELAHFEAEYSDPTGAFLLAAESDAYIGCVGLRRFLRGTGEVKRLYVAPSARGRGLGRMLAEAIVARAREIGYGRLVLDTLPSMKQARALYESLGFRPIPPYRFNPIEGTNYLELVL